MTRASIAIFPKKVEYSDNRTRPEIPDEIFELAQKMADQKSGCELVRSKTGLYIVMYSETGPSTRAEGWENWLPVYVAKIKSWTSGGIQQEEMEQFLDAKSTTTADIASS